MKADPNLQDYQGRTPLNLACKEGVRDLVEILLRHGADPNLRDAWGVCPLYSAVVWTCDDKVSAEAAVGFLQSLVDAGGDSDLPNERGSTCFVIARPDVVPLLEKARRGGGARK